MSVAAESLSLLCLGVDKNGDGAVSVETSALQDYSIIDIGTIAPLKSGHTAHGFFAPDVVTHVFSTPDFVITEPKECQTQSCIRMLEVETSSTSRIGVFGNPPGSGKTLTVLLLFGNMPSLQFPAAMPVAHGFDCLFDFKLDQDRIKSAFTIVKACNVCVVPTHVVSEWKFQIVEKHCCSPSSSSTRFVFFTTIAEVRKFFSNNTTSIALQRKLSISIIIITHNAFATFMGYIKSARLWLTRLVIDEADTISLPPFIHTYFSFIWLMTGTPANIFFPSGKVRSPQNILPSSNEYIKYDGVKSKTSFVRHITNRLMSVPLRIRGDMYLQNTVMAHPDMVKRSFDIEECVHETVLCRHDNAVYQIFVREMNNMDTEVIKMIYAENMIAIKRHYNIEGSFTAAGLLAQINIQQGILKRKREADNDLNESTRGKRKRVAGVRNDEKILQRIKNNDRLITSLECIVSSNDDTTHTTCGIFGCTNSIQISCMMCSGCNKLICQDCYSNLSGKRKSCPFCRQVNDGFQVHYESTSVSPGGSTPTTPLGSKSTTLCDIIRGVCVDNVLKEKILVYVDSSDGSFGKACENIEDFLDQDVIFNGASSKRCITRKISEFQDENSKLRVLVITPSQAGTGVNFNIADRIILYHRMSSCVTKQVESRAQRPGRKGQLTIQTLVYENEGGEGGVGDEIETS